MPKDFDKWNYKKKNYKNEELLLFVIRGKYGIYRILREFRNSKYLLYLKVGRCSLKMKSV